MSVRDRLADRRKDAAAWAAEARWWPARAALLLVLAYLGARHVLEPEYGSILSGITLGVHELGHLVFAPLGQWLGAAGGSILQVAAPLALAWGFLRQRDYYAVAVAGAWEGMSLANLATYIADARAEALPLVSPFAGDAQHDWNYLLESLYLLKYDTLIGGWVRLAAGLVLALALWLGAWLCVRMARGRPAGA